MNGERTTSKKSRKETSKTLLLVLLIGLGITSVATIIFSFLFADSSPLVVLIETIGRLASVAVGFYYWKAKCENMQKYKKTNKIGEISDEVKVYE